MRKVLLESICILQKEVGRATRAGDPYAGTATRARGSRIITGMSAVRTSPWTRAAAVAVWAVAFALVEAMVVYYLRRLFAIEHHLRFAPADVQFPRAYLPYERAREAATMVMLLAVGFLAGRTWWQRLACWLLAFGVWDIFYYVWLWVLLRWPSSPGPATCCS